MGVGTALVGTGFAVGDGVAVGSGVGFDTDAVVDVGPAVGTTTSRLSEHEASATLEITDAATIRTVRLTGV